MLSPGVEQALDKAIQLARSRRHELVTAEHLLMSLLDDADAATLLVACKANISNLRQDLQEHLASQIPTVVIPPDYSDSKKASETEGDPEEGALEVEEFQPQLTLAFKRILQRAVVQVQSSGRNQVETSHLIVAMFDERESFAVYYLQKQGLSRFDVITVLSHGLPKESTPLIEGADHRSEGSSTSPDPLQTYAVNLNEKARQGKIDTLVGRADVLERVVQTLCRRTKNNPLLLGDPGVGKTAIIEGLAKRIEEGDVPEAIQGLTIYALDMGSLLAGTKFRGDFEERLKNLIVAIQSKPSRSVLFIDEIHTLVGAGGTQGGSMDASNLLKPALSRGELSCIGSTTFKDYRQHFEKDRALSRRFQTIEVREPSAEDAIAILKGLRTQYEKHHGVSYSDEALKAAVTLSIRHLPALHLPDKAFDVIDEAGARARLKSRPAGSADRSEIRIEAHDIEEVIAKIARVPSQNVHLDEKKKLQSLSKNLKLLVFGQDEAIDVVASTIKVVRAGLGGTQKPVGSFLFVGPTGVGKTEVAKQLSKALGVHFLRFDMSEYMEKHSVARMIGSPPGYVGFEEGGLLTEAINKNPHSVLLLDEIEKAHPDLLNVLLQVMDNGTLTDTNGRTSDFRNVTLIMTSNAGARDTAKGEIGIVPQESKGMFLEAVKQTFSPEFVNRLDAVVPFGHLSREVLSQVTGKFLMELQNQLLEKKVELNVSESAKAFLMEKGYDKAYGARPMARTIQDHLKKPLIDELLFGALADNGGLIEVETNPTTKALVFRFVPHRPMLPKAESTKSSTEKA